MENSEVLDCVACFRQFEGTEISAENVRKIFTVCSNYLKPEVFTKSWNSLRPAEKSSPFCKGCYSSAEKLSILSQRLEDLQKEIDNFVEYFSAQIQQHKILGNFRSTSDDDITAQQIKYEIPIQRVLVKEETADFDDLPPSPVPSPTEPLLIEKNEELHEEKVTRNLRKVIIPIQRLQFDVNGDIVQEKVNERKTRTRKSVAFSRDSDYESSEQSSDSDDDYKNDEPQRKTTRLKLDGEECDKCGAKFASKRGLREHRLKNHLENVKIYECDFCYVQYKVKKEYLRHIRTHSRPFSCEECGESFDKKERFLGSNQYDYEIHSMTHKEEIPFACKVCEQVFSNPKNYVHHQKFGCPLTPASFKCPSCDKMFKAEYLAFMHLLEHRDNPKDDKEDCALCPKFFSAAKDHYKHQKLEMHYMTTHTKEYPISCDICDMPFRNSANFNAHRVSHKPRSAGGHKLDCPHCQMKFNWRQSLREHIKKRHDTSAVTYTCQYCQKEFKLQKEFNRHVKQHSMEQTFNCTECPRTFTRSASLHFHLKMHSGEFTCHHCQHKCASRSSLKLHVDTVHLNLRPFLCDICGKGFSCHSSQQSHIEKIHGASRKSSHTCEICGENFVREYSYKEHMRLHTGNQPDSSEFPFICDVCGKLFRTEATAKLHQKTAHVEEEGEEAEKLQCDDCGKMFTRKGGLREHRKRKHDLTAETFVCPIENCSAKFKIRKELSVHVKRHNSSIPCGMCQKTFRCSAQLKAHRRLHTGELFECSHCGKSFVSPGRLQIHVSSVHLKEKHFFCEVCGKGFFEKKAYKAHLSTHSDAKIFECKVCGEKFNTDHKRKDHRRKMHTGEVFDCHICGKNFSRKSTLRLHIKKHARKASKTPNETAVSEDPPLWSVK